MRKWMTAVVVLAALAGVAGMVYWQWDTIWAVALSPLGGLIAKIVFGGKVLKVLVGVAFAAAAGALGVRRWFRRDPEPVPFTDPPVFGPPEQEAPPAAPEPPPAVPPPAAPAVPEPPPAVPEPSPAPVTSTGTGTATTTGLTKVRSGQPT